MRIEKSIRLFELEGRVALLEVVEVGTDGYLQHKCTLESGEHMLLPGPGYDFPVAIDDGFPVDANGNPVPGPRDPKRASTIAVRSFVVPATNRVGAVVDSKRYVFGDTLADTQTLEDYLATDYSGKPKSGSPASAVAAF